MNQNMNCDNYTDLLEAVTTQRKNELSVLRKITEVQATKAYKIHLLLKRSRQQLLRERQRKDYLKWVFSKLTKREFGARMLREFDELENVKTQLRESILSVEEVIGISDERFVLKDTSRVFIFASVPFFDVGGGQRSAQLARTFNTLGKQVYYIYGFPCSEENVPDMVIPVSGHRYLGDTELSWFEKRIGPGDLAVFEIPHVGFEPYLDCAKKKGAYTVYEHIDNWDTTLGCLFYQEDVFRQFLEKADLITVTARMLGEKIREHSSRDYVYLPNAVNIEIFEPSKTYQKPDDLICGKNKTLLYFGSLWGDWFDWEKLDYIAKKCPDCEINLIGDYSGCKNRVANAPKNMHFLGIKRQTELPAYLAYTDVALLPFKNCEIGKYVSPLKIFEYIAMNVRVLATPLDDIQDYPNVVCSDTKEGWVAALKENPKLENSSVFISNNNWFARCGVMLEKAGQIRKEYPSVSVIILNYNNMKVIGRCVDTLLAHRGHAGYEIIVVDNQSKDGSYEMLKEKYADQIVLVRNDKNGCSSGRNLGVKHAKGEYICFLDSDQWVISDLWLEATLDAFEKNKGVGAIAWNAGWFNHDDVRGPIVDGYDQRAIKSSRYLARNDVAYLATSGFLMHKDLFEEIGGFDEFFDPTCYEDTDLSLKVRYAGYEILYCPYMAIMHIPHQTTNSGSAAHAELMKRNGEYFTNKWNELKPELLEYYLDDTTV